MEGRQTKGTRLAWEWEEHVQSGEEPGGAEEGSRVWREFGGRGWLRDCDPEFGLCPTRRSGSCPGVLSWLNYSVIL